MKLLKILERVEISSNSKKKFNNYCDYKNSQNQDYQQFFDKRNFSRRQKKILLMLSGNKCNKCGKILHNKFHADHIKPWTKKGKTILQNGQALCGKCNLKKGAKYEKD